MPFSVGIGLGALGAELITAATSPSSWARMASIMYSLAIVLAPIRPQRTLMPRLAFLRLGAAIGTAASRTTRLTAPI